MKSLRKILGTAALITGFLTYSPANSKLEVSLKPTGELTFISCKPREIKTDKYFIEADDGIVNYVEMYDDKIITAVVRLSENMGDYHSVLKDGSVVKGTIPMESYQRIYNNLLRSKGCGIQDDKKPEGFVENN